MGVRKIEDRAVRKIFKIGYQRSHAVVLPIEHIRALKWRAGQEVMVVRQGRHLLVRPSK